MDVRGVVFGKKKIWHHLITQNVLILRSWTWVTDQTNIMLETRKSERTMYGGRRWILMCLGLFEKQTQQLVFGRKSHFNFYASYKIAFAQFIYLNDAMVKAQIKNQVKDF